MQKPQQRPQQRLLIVGCGDIARRTLPQLLGHYRVFALLRRAEQLSWWRQAGAFPLLADLDDANSLHKIAGLADIVLHFAPPPANKIATIGERKQTKNGDHRAGQARHDTCDTRTRHLLSALGRGGSLPRRLVYLSTSGVYGDCGGARIDETQPTRAQTLRAQRRIDAEKQLRAFAQRHGVNTSILRTPGIYASERLPLERLRQGLPCLIETEDVFTNHIHADDLARLVCATLRHGRSNRIYNAADDSNLKMGAYFDLVAEQFGLAKPPRVTRQQSEHLISALQRSFMNESRRLSNQRIKNELHFCLHYPQVEAGITAAWRSTCPASIEGSNSINNTNITNSSADPLLKQESESALRLS
ncbi:MAG: SDR family oxidoreductase [Pseudomonadota bacterium]